MFRPPPAVRGPKPNVRQLQARGSAMLARGTLFSSIDAQRQRQGIGGPKKYAKSARLLNHPYRGGKNYIPPTRLQYNILSARAGNPQLNSIVSPSHPQTKSEKKVANLRKVAIEGVAPHHLGFSPVKGFLGGINAVGQVAQDIYGIPGGIYAVGKAGYESARHGTPTPLENIAKAQYQAINKQIHDPYHNIGHLAFLGAAAASGGLEAAGRAGLIKDITGPTSIKTMHIESNPAGKLPGINRFAKVQYNSPTGALARTTSKMVARRMARIANTPWAERSWAEKHLYTPEGKFARHAMTEAQIEADMRPGANTTQIVRNKAWRAGSDKFSNPHQQLVLKSPSGKYTIATRERLAKQGYEFDKNGMLVKVPTQNWAKHTAEEINPATKEPYIRQVEYKGQSIDSENARWIDKRLMPETKSPPAAKAVDVMTAISAPFKFAQVYAKPAFAVVNHAQMVLQAMAHHPIKFIPTYLKNMKKIHGAEVDNLADQAIGTLKGETLQAKYLGAKPLEATYHGATPESWVGEKWGSRYVKARSVGQKITEWQTRAADVKVRKTLLYLNFAKRGITDTKDLRVLLDPTLGKREPFASGVTRELERGPKTKNMKIADLRSLRNDVVRESREDSLHFENLRPSEKSLAAFIYFYPYLRSAVRLSGRYAMNHPYATAAGLQAGQIGNREFNKEVGAIPNWMQGFVSPAKGYMVNPNPLSTPATTAQIYTGLTGGYRSASKSSIEEQFGTPVMQFLSTSDPMKGFLDQFGGTVPGTVLRRLGIWHPVKTFPPPKSAAGKAYDVGSNLFLGAPGTLRKYSKEEVARQARKQHHHKRGSGGGLFGSSGGSSGLFGGGSSSSGLFSR